MSVGSDTANAPDTCVTLDYNDVMEICEGVKGNFAQDPLMYYAVACSTDVDPNVKPQFEEAVRRSMRKSDQNLRVMSQAGVKRLGSTAEQEAMVERISHKRLFSEEEQN